jgi:hypothetical protein
MIRFLWILGLFGLALALAGCGGRTVTPAPVPEPVRLLAMLSDTQATLAVFAPLYGDPTGAGYHLGTATIDACAAGTWLPYWEALLPLARAVPVDGDAFTQTVRGVTATLACRPEAGDPRYQFAFTLTLDGTDTITGLAFHSHVPLTGRVGRSGTQTAVALVCVDSAGPATLTLTRDDAGAGTVDLAAPTLQTHTTLTRNAKHAITHAECSVHAGDRLLRRLCFDADNQALPGAAARYAAWYYDPDRGDPAQDALSARVTLHDDNTGTLYAYQPITGSWQETAVALGY